MQLNTKGIPRYVQAREHLTKQIRSGELQSGDKLPPENDLAAKFGVSRMTIRKSIDDLVGAGLVYRRHGVGVFVSQSPFQRDHTHLTDFFETCRKEGRVPSSKVIRRELTKATEKQANALSIAKGDDVIRFTTLRAMDDNPITYHDAYLPLSLFPEFTEIAEQNFEDKHVWQIIEELGFSLANVVEKLEAQIANAAMANYLNINKGSAILYGERVLYSEEGTPLKYAECYNRGDMYSLTVVLVK